MRFTNVCTIGLVVLAAWSGPSAAHAQSTPRDVPHLEGERNSPALLSTGITVGTVGLANIATGISLLLISDSTLHEMSLHALHEGGRQYPIGAVLIAGGAALAGVAIPLVFVGGARREAAVPKTALVVQPASAALRHEF